MKRKASIFLNPGVVGFFGGAGWCVRKMSNQSADEYN